MHEYIYYQQDLTTYGVMHCRKQGDPIKVYGLFQKQLLVGIHTLLPCLAPRLSVRSNSAYPLPHETLTMLLPVLPLVQPLFSPYGNCYGELMYSVITHWLSAVVTGPLVCLRTTHGSPWPPPLPPVPIWSPVSPEW